jgi:hypothetical protein
MDANAYLMEQKTGQKPDYCARIKLFCIGGEGDDYASRISFYELRPRSEEFIWIEALPGDSCLRANADSGKMERAKLDEVCAEIVETLDVRRTY